MTPGTHAHWRDLPAPQARRAREFAVQASGAAGHAAPPRPAATVVLLRDGAQGIEVYLHRRHNAMAFAGGMAAFPGGGVEPEDRAGEAVPAWADQLDPDIAAARAFVRGALRETLEETGVQLDPALLVPWARWITPRFEPRRYDTWFFLTGVPEGQQPSDVSGEVEDVMWAPAREAIRRADIGELRMMTPTRAVLGEMSGFASAASALAAGSGRVIETVLPGWVDTGDHVRILLPGDDGYPGDDQRGNDQPSDDSEDAP